MPSSSARSRPRPSSSAWTRFAPHCLQPSLEIAVFEIGSSLRDARERRNLKLSEVERATRIRAKYLQALEDERFDILPAAAYAKGFLREYADYLGLDAQRFVDEYNSRFAPAEEPVATPLVRVRRRRPT